MGTTFSFKFLTLIPILIFAISCSQDVQIDSLANKPLSSSTTDEACVEDALLGKSCHVKETGKVVTSKFGQDVITWENPTASNTISSKIDDGYYYNRSSSFTDIDLDPTNIKSGVNLFGVTGTFTGASGTPCTDETLNVPSCVTNTSRYVYQNQYGGRIDNCSSGLNSGACWTNASNRYVASNLGGTVSGAEGQKTQTIPLGFYDGTTSAVMSDVDLVNLNIRSGTVIFGVTGNLIEKYSNCSEDTGTLNSGQCSTTAARYVYSTLYGGRSNNCSEGFNSLGCWTNSTSKYVTGNAGGAVTGVNGQLSKVIPAGYYDGSTSATMSDTNLISGKIKSGETIFGVSGSFTGAVYGACTDDQFSNPQCLTNTDRYIYVSEYGGRAQNCTLGLNSAQCWTQGANLFVTNQAGNNVIIPTGTLQTTIPIGYYDGTETATASDADLDPTNIRSGVDLFGTVGTLDPKLANCTDNASNPAACSTANNRFVYTTIMAGRSADCSLGSNVTACWTNANNRYVSDTLGTNITPANGTIGVVIPAGYYNGTTTVTMSDTDLVANNIRDTITVFGITGNLTERYAFCSDEAYNTGNCTTVPGRYVTQYNGTNIIGSDGDSIVTIDTGFYDGTETTTVNDTDLSSGNIKNGINIFGVIGTYSGPVYTNCTDNQFSNPQCLTNTDRYIYINEYGGRTGLCTNGLNSGACWTNAANMYVTSSSGSNVFGVSGSLSAPIPQGYYSSGTSATMSDTDLTASNIRNSVNVFGTIGTLIEKYSNCSEDSDTNNSSECSTSPNSYVYSALKAGRSQNCSLGANGSACWTNNSNRFVASNLGTNLTPASGIISATIPSGYYDGSTSATMSDSNLVSANIKSGTTIFGVTGTFGSTYQTLVTSNAPRSFGAPVFPNLISQYSTQLTLSQETSYNGNFLPNSGGLVYRDVPDINLDDDGVDGLNCSYSKRPTTDCGIGTTIALKIADCAAANPLTSTWDGSVRCNGGQGLWKLISRNGANKELWQDQRTGLIWSSLVASAASTNWCRASGNSQSLPAQLFSSNLIIPNSKGNISAIQGGISNTGETVTITFTGATTFSVTGSQCLSGTITAGGLTTTPGSSATFSRAGYCSFTITQGTTNFQSGDNFQISIPSSANSCTPSVNQTASPVSYCSEVGGLDPALGETWPTSYHINKGYLGKGSTPSVMWRLPTLADYRLAELNGVRFVMPDMGIVGASRINAADASPGGATEWTATLAAQARANAWTFNTVSGVQGSAARTAVNAARCVGR